MGKVLCLTERSYKEQKVDSFDSSSESAIESVVNNQLIHSMVSYQFSLQRRCMSLGALAGRHVLTISSESGCQQHGG